MQSKSSKKSISQIFTGKTIAITGATGFIGQVLVEKLLRSCPGVSKILLLVRSKHGVSSDGRLKHFAKSSVFEKLKKSQPDFSSKLAAISFALESDDNWGLSQESYKLIKSEVNIVFHVAATVRFNEKLRRSFDVNTLAVRRLLKICRNITNLEAIVHVSTGYCYCNYENIEEKVFPTGWEYDKLHDTMKWMTDDMIAKLTPDILRDRPNTYTLTKALGEEIIVREGVGLPICIVRPSIVGTAAEEPIPGWCFTMHGPVGLCAVYGKGWLRIICGNHVNAVDTIPVDYVANGMIAAAWKTALVAKKGGPLKETTFDKDSLSDKLQWPTDYKLRSLGFTKPRDTEEMTFRRKSLPIYQLVANADHRLKLEDLRDKGEKILNDYPFDEVARPPFLILSVTNKYIYYVISFLLEHLPAIIIDAGRILTGHKPRLFRLSLKMTNTVHLLSYFYQRSWVWEESSVTQLENDLSEEDRKEFPFRIHSMVWDDYILNGAKSLRKYVLKEDPKGFPIARRRLWRLRVLYWCIQYGTYLLMWRWIMSWSGIERRSFQFRPLLSLLLRFLRSWQIPKLN